VRQPNVLIFHCHDLGQFSHCYGVETVRTPHLDAFAAEGVRFSRSFCTAPQCSPSRASIFTGRYPHNNGVMGLTHSHFAWDLYPEERHLGEILRDAGYTTMGIGIIHETRSGPERCGLEDYLPRAFAVDVVDQAIERLTHLAGNSDRPFYMQAGCIEPHRLATTGVEDPMGFIGNHLQPDTTLGVSVPGYLRDTEGTRTEIAELQGAVHHLDEQFGRLMAAVRELKLEKNTLLIFTTDHGMALPRAKCSLYEPGLLVAFMLRYAPRDGWHGGRVMDEMISNIDYLPTILELVGLPAPTNVQGRSLVPLLDGDDYAPRDAIFGEMTYHDYHDPRRSLRTETHKLIVNFTTAPYFMDPSQSWRPRSDTIFPPSPARMKHPTVELYDLRDDPFELHDIAEEPSQVDVLKEMLARLHRHLVKTEDPILEGPVLSPAHRNAVALLRESA